MWKKEIKTCTLNRFLSSFVSLVLYETAQLACLVNIWLYRLYENSFRPFFSCCCFFSTIRVFQPLLYARIKWKKKKVSSGKRSISFGNMWSVSFHSLEKTYNMLWICFASTSFMKCITCIFVYKIHGSSRSIK